ncbi:halocyanin [Salinadaptatus halalkaliphilus]|uniref:Halocyanin n=1 Tax=Salinadaptatus halalkaliphilus TaxID=2419781 RepID=A0A4S3TSX8_9EURY|nr:plastocyanin/azurin family copper-binding protein [Salinadaptatus halalkaliphilus]THE66535.1 halocyanin [Salinadaptatus halalkaliphilus]
MTHTRRRTLEVATTASITALAGCLGGRDAIRRGGDDGDPGSPEGSSGDGTLGDPAAAVEVTVVTRPSPQFEPGLVHVEPGGTVRWLVEGPRHDVTAYHSDVDRPQRVPDGTDAFESGLLREGHEFEHTFDDPGVYDYVDTRRLCGSHEALGAVGRVVVGWPELETEPALEHDVSGLPSRAETVMAAYDERTREALAEV